MILMGKSMVSGFDFPNKTNPLIDGTEYIDGMIDIIPVIIPISDEMSGQMI